MDQDRRGDVPDRPDEPSEAMAPEARVDGFGDEEDVDEDVLDIDLEDLPDDSAAAPSGNALVITLADLADVPEAPPVAPAPTPAAGLYPGVDAKMLEAEKAGGEIDMYCLCSETGQPFIVYWSEVEPGVYAVSRVESVVPERAGGGSGCSEIAGTFGLADFEGCPHCGCRGLSVCEACGTTNCEGAVQRTIFPPMQTLRCPNCGNRGNLHGQAAAAYGSRGGKGKKWSK